MTHRRTLVALTLGQRCRLLLMLPAMLLALLLQGIAVQPASAQEGSLTCGAAVPILSVQNNSYSAEPALTENGDHVIFWSTANPPATDNPDGNIEVFSASLSLTQTTFAPQFRQLTGSKGSILGGFNLAPAVDGVGRYVTFFSDRDLAPGQNLDANFEIFRLDTQSGEILQIRRTVRGANLFPSISADGRLIAFVSDIARGAGQTGTDDVQGNQEIFIADLTDPAAITFKQVTTTPLGVINEDPVLSGDGRILAFVSDVDGNSEIYTYTVGSGIAPVNVTKTTGGTNAHPSLNFDGSRLVFLSDQALESGKTTGGLPQVVLYPNPQTGSGFFQVTATGSHNHPVIGGVGNRISYQRIVGSQEDIMLYDVVNESERQLSASAAGRQRLNTSISRNGTVIAYEDTGAIYVINCPIADLSLAVDSNADTAIAGAPFAYQWQVTNLGTSSAAEVVVSAALPTGFKLSQAGDASPECSQTANQVQCNLPLLTVSETKMLTIPVVIDPDVLGTKSITVSTLSSNVTDPDPRNNSRTITTLVDAEADLVLVQPRSTTTAPLFDEPITYTLVLSNLGPSAARSVRITDTLPAEVTFESAAQCTVAAGVVSCSVDAVAPGEVVTRTIVARVSALDEVQIVNRAAVGSITRDTNAANNLAERVDGINTTFDLAQSQALEPAYLRAGAPITYSFAITNFGPSVAEAVEISLTLPPRFAPDTDEDGHPLFCGLYTCTAGIDTSLPFTVNVGTMSRAERVDVLIPGRMDPAFSGQITSTATVYSAAEPSADRNLSNNDSEASYEVFQEADLIIEPIDLLSEVVAGAPVTYVISTLNGRPSVASNVVLTFSIQPSVTLTALDVNVGTCSGSTLVTCAVDVLTPTERLVVTATGMLDAALTGVLTVSAGVNSDTEDLIPDFDRRTRVDDVINRAEFTLRNQPSSLQAVSGQSSLLFDLVVTNLGPSLARTVVLTNVLPISTTAGQIFVPNNVTCAAPARTIVCDVGSVNAGTSLTVSVEAAVNADALGTLINRATVDSDITAPLTVDSAAVSTIQRADLRVSKSASVADRNLNGQIDVGEQITYTVVLSNVGPSNASSIVISDQIPALLGTVLTQTTEGSFANDLWTVGSLAAGRQTTLTVSALLGDVASGQVITNTALIQSVTQPDSQSDNNSSTVVVSVAPAADLAVAMSVSDAAPKVLDQITYQITVTNNGPEDATGVSVTDVLPFALEYVTHTLASVDYDRTSGLWQIGVLGVGQSAYLSISARVIGSGVIENTAGVGGTLADPDLVNNSASAPISVDRAADLSLTQAFSDETPNVNDDLVIVLTLSNNGPDSAENIIVSYPVPALLNGATVTADGFGHLQRHRRPLADPHPGRRCVNDVNCAAHAQCLRIAQQCR